MFFTVMRKLRLSVRADEMSPVSPRFSSAMAWRTRTWSSAPKPSSWSSPGEEHEFGFGADDQVRVRHAIANEKRGETGLISSAKTDSRNFRITVKNMHERAVELVVHDNVPVSQNDDIKVELVGPAQPTKTDIDGKRGVIAFESKLGPEEERLIEFGYRIIWPGARGIVYR